MKLSSVTQSAHSRGLLRWGLVTVAVALLFSPLSTMAQCSMCRTTLARSPQGQALARGFNDGILFLLGVPFVLAGGILLKIRAASRFASYDAGDDASDDPSKVYLPSTPGTTRDACQPVNT